MASVIATFGNPLLDIYVLTTNKKILDEFNFEEGSKAEIPKEQFNSLYKYVKDHYEVQYRAGGSAQNTSQILQWVMGNKYPKFVTFFGTIGNDENGNQLQIIMNKANVSTRYSVCSNHITGACIAIVTNNCPTFLAHIGAAEKYELSYLENVPNNMKVLSEVEMIYVEGFFIANRLSIVEYLFNYAMCNNKLFIFNLNAAYLFGEMKEYMNYFALNCDILFGNKVEYEALFDSLNIDGEKSLKKIALYLSNKYKLQKNNKYNVYKKVVVITDDSNPVLCISEDDKCFEVKVPKISSLKIKDTSGAGDAFVAGFLAALAVGKDLPLCVKWGCWTAGKIIQEIGCIIPQMLLEELYSLT